jgi:hypothetical protein
MYISFINRNRVLLYLYVYGCISDTFLLYYWITTISLCISLLYLRSHFVPKIIQINLLKRGFNGLSHCALCFQNSETIDHLLDECLFASSLWDNASIIFRRSDRIRGNNMWTLKSWNPTPFQNDFLNIVWKLFLGFLVLEIWKD